MENPAELYTIYFVFFGFALIFSWLINSLFLKFASTLGIRNQTDTVIRWAKTSKPSLGGFSFYIVFLLSVAGYSVFFGKSTILLDRQLLGFVSATTMAFLVGLADDAYNTRPILKFSIQLLCAAILISTGTYIHLFSNQYLDYFITMVWVVGVMNSINMLDNMDGITTIVSICIISFALYEQYSQGNFNHIYIMVLIGVLASLIGFLYFNWFPSKMFMGDTGSQFLGLVLSALGIVCFWNAPDAHGEMIQTKQFLCTALVFIIPACDTICVIINRILHRRSPFIGGRDHTTHNLFFLGISERRIAVLFAIITIVSTGLALLLLQIKDWNFLHIALFFGYFLAVLVFFLYVVRVKK